MSFQQSILETSDFLKHYASYKESINISSLTDFLDNIDTNKKYYRMGIQKNKRYKKEVTKDTEHIKKITSLINKITDSNYEILKRDIMSNIKVDYIIPYIVETLAEHSLVHHIYIPLYVGILKDIPSPKTCSNVSKICDKYYQTLFVDGIDVSGESSYLQLCAKNKRIDKIIGFSLFITHVEDNGILTDYVEKILDPFMEQITVINDDIEIFKMLTSFYNISLIRYKTTPIPDKYRTTLENVKQSTKTSKIKFKIMDILGE